MTNIGLPHWTAGNERIWLWICTIPGLREFAEKFDSNAQFAVCLHEFLSVISGGCNKWTAFTVPGLPSLPGTTEEGRKLISSRNITSIIEPHKRCCCHRLDFKTRFYLDNRLHSRKRNEYGNGDVMFLSTRPRVKVDSLRCHDQNFSASPLKHPRTGPRSQNVRPSVLWHSVAHRVDPVVASAINTHCPEFGPSTVLKVLMFQHWLKSTFKDIKSPKRLLCFTYLFLIHSTSYTLSPSGWSFQSFLQFKIYNFNLQFNILLNCLQSNY
jgi:hypothetical protein